MTAATYRQLAADGMTIRQAADHLGRSYRSVLEAAWRAGIKFTRAKDGRPAIRTESGGLPRQTIYSIMGPNIWETGEIARHVGMWPKRALYHLRVMEAAGQVVCMGKDGKHNRWKRVPKRKVEK
jgi:hypothetical protein